MGRRRHARVRYASGHLRRVALTLALAALSFTGLVLAAAPRALAAEPEAPAAAAHPGAQADAASEHAEEPEGINWYYGFIAQKEGAKPSLLWRPKGMEPPLFAEVFDALILYWLVFKIARKPLADALKKRRSAIMHGMEEAGKMRDDAAERLAGYEEKLKHVDEEIERVKKEMREAGERERERILAEAKDKRERMEHDAQVLIDQELKAAREMLLRETVQSAVRAAQALLEKQVTTSDQQRLADDYVEGVRRAEIHVPGGHA